MKDQDRSEHPALPKTLATVLPPPEVTTEAQTFRLFDLPDELWVRIGQMVIDDAPAFDIRAIRTKPCTNEEIEMYRKITISSDLTPPAILQTCTAFRKELRNGYYRGKIAVTASYHLGNPIWAIIGRYLRMVGPEARGQIRVVTENAQWSWGPRKGLLRPPLRRGVRYWEWEMMFTPTRVLAAHGEDEDQRATEWEITFL